ncbi:glycine--tRNA ligase [Candidatus Dependentiae bacterium]
MNKKNKKSGITLDKIVALCKRRGFVYQSADIYGGLNGVYDFGHLGLLLKNNIRNAWTKSISSVDIGDVLLLEGALLGPRAVWEASGHIDCFHDPMVDCQNCKHRYRADHIDLEKACPNCGQKKWTEIKQFNMMFKTQLGASAGSASEAYLRPETAQAIFTNFKNMMSTNRVKIPFGIAQIGKAFRNEINPRQFLFRMREFEQMEVEWFCKKDDADKFFDFWQENRLDFVKKLGVNPEKLRLRPHAKDELAHYSIKCSDVEYEFPFGWQELEGIAHRGNYDLSQHSKHSGKDLAVFDDATKESYIPDVVECSVGVDRLFLTLLFDAYKEDVIDGESRTVLKLDPAVAPIKAAILPLTKKQLEQSEKIFKDLKIEEPHIMFDVSGSIGKRYRRQDEIGTPVCFTYDFDSDNDHMVTARDRNTTEQKRIPIDKIKDYLRDILQ